MHNSLREDSKLKRMELSFSAIMMFTYLFHSEVLTAIGSIGITVEYRHSWSPEDESK